MKEKVLGAFIRGRRVWAWFAVLLIVMSLITVPSGRADRVMAEGEVVSSNDLKDFIQSVTIRRTPIEMEGSTYILKPGNTYKVTMTFQEDDNTQMKYGNGQTLTYTLPSEFTVPNGYHGKAEVKISGAAELALPDCTYDVSGDTLTFTWNYGDNDEDTIDDYLRLSSTTNLVVELDGEFNGGEALSDLCDEWKISAKYDNSKALTVEKSVEKFHDDTGIVDYKIKVTSKGNNKNIKVEDVFAESGILAKNIDETTIKAEETERIWEPVILSDIDVTSSDGFTCTIDNMEDGDVIEITYSAAIDMDIFSPEHMADSDIDGDIHLSTNIDTTNNVTLTPDRTPEPGDILNDDARLEGDITYPGITKEGQTEAISDDGIAEVNWKLTLNSYKNSGLSGKKLSDVFGGEYASLMSNASADTFKVEKTVYTDSGSGFTAGTKDELTTGTLDYTEGGKGWDYTFPHTETPGDYNEYYSYTITYKTNVDVSDEYETINVSNTATLEDYTKTTASTGVGPAEFNTPKVSKSVISGHEYMDWTVTVDIPAAGIDSTTPVILEDVYPYRIKDSYWDIELGETVTTKYQDTLYGDVSVTWDKTGNESFTVDTSDPAKFDIIFTKTTGSNPYGFEKTGSKRTITISYRTKNDAEWVEKSDNGDSTYLDHENVATLTIGAHNEKGTAIGRPIIRKMEKSVYVQSPESDNENKYIYGSTYIYKKVQNSWWSEGMGEELRYSYEPDGEVPYYKFDIILNSVDSSLFDDGEGNLTKE